MCPPVPSETKRSRSRACTNDRVSRDVYRPVRRPCRSDSNGAAPRGAARVSSPWMGRRDQAKSVFARRLAAALDAPIVHLDDLYPGLARVARGPRPHASRRLVHALSAEGKNGVAKEVRACTC